MRRTFKINNRISNKKFLRRKLFINFIVFFLLLELLFTPLSVASSSTSDAPGGDNKTTDSSNTSPSSDDSPADSSSGSSSGDDSPADSDSSSSFESVTPTYTKNGSSVLDYNDTDSSSNSSNIDDNTTNSSNDSYVLYDKLTDSSSDYFISNDIPINSSGYSIIEIDNYSYAQNERIVSTDEIVSITENTLGDLSSGIEKEVKIEYFGDIDSIKLTPATDLKEVKLTIIKLKNKPEEIIDPPLKNISIYKYLDIKLISNNTYIDEDEIESLEFKFKVEKSWIIKNKIDKETIRLIRYHDGVWQNLSTNLIDENELYINYTADFSGFSTFAVVGNIVVLKSDSYSWKDVSIPWSIIIAFIILLTILLVIILFKARYIYLKDDSK